MAAQYASMEEAEADAKEYIETTVKKAFDHLQPIEDTGEPYKAGDLVLCVQGRRVVPFLISGAII